MKGSKGVTPAYLAWKRAGSPGRIWCLACDRPADEGHIHAERIADRLAEIGEAPEPEPEVKPEVRHVESLIEWYKAGQRPDAVLTMQEWLAAVKSWKMTQ